jgi:hypothetical protein
MRWGAAIESMPPDVEPTTGDDTGNEQAAPERRLLLAVLVDAILCVRRLAAPSSQAARRAGAEAKRWISSDDRVLPCSFVNVCDSLDLAYQPLRRALLCALPSATDKRGVRAARRLAPRRNPIPVLRRPQAAPRLPQPSPTPERA